MGNLLSKPSENLSVSIVGVSVAFVLFSMYTAASGVWPDVNQHGVHLSLAIILVYLRAQESGNRYGIIAMLSCPDMRR